MSVPKRRRRTKTGELACKACVHKHLDEIDLLLLSADGSTLGKIPERMKLLYPSEPVLSKNILATHKRNHLFDKALNVVTAEGKEVTFIGSGVKGLEGDLPIPEIGYSAAQTLRVLINAGVNYIRNHPESVTPTVTLQAIAELRRSGKEVNEDEDFRDAVVGAGDFMDKLDSKIKKSRKRTKRTVTVQTEEEIDETSSEGKEEEEVREVITVNYEDIDFSERN